MIHAEIAMCYYFDMAKSLPKTNLDLVAVASGEWEKRSDMWRQKTENTRRKRPSKKRTKRPLILAGHGVTLRIERNTLLVKNGLTHYPQEPEIIRYFSGDLDLPPRIVFLDCSGSISFNVLAWLQEQNVDLLHLNWQGEIIATTSNTGTPTNLEKVFWQRATYRTHDRRMQFATELIAEKFQRSIKTLNRLNLNNDACQKAVEFLQTWRTTLLSEPPETISDLLLVEAHCAAAYFRAWKGVTLAWKGKSRKFIPNHWAAFDQRSSDINLTGNRHATHPINA